MRAGRRFAAVAAAAVVVVTLTQGAASAGGSSWSASALPWSMSGPASPELVGVGCAGALCVAVGDNAGPLVATTDGGTWSASGPGIPADAETVFLRAVSCTPAVACVSVGTAYLLGGGTAAVVGTTTPSGTTLEQLPDPGEATNAQLTSVSCVASSCVGVGHEVVGGVTQPLVETLTAGVWSASSLSLAAIGPTASGALLAVSCVDATDCTAVGETTNRTPYHSFVAVLASGTWSVQLVSLPSGVTGLLDGLSCVAATCMAVGLASSARAVVDTLTGGSSSFVTLPLPTGVTYETLDAVSCSAAGACSSVGYARGSQPDGVEATFDGSWSQSLLVPSGAGPIDLQGVTCAAGTCIAAGLSVSETGSFAVLASSTGGGPLSLIPLTVTGAPIAKLDGVACPTSASCVAVGDGERYRTGDVAIVERRAGSGWVESEPAPPSGAVSAALSGISCPAAGTCWAAGSYLDARGDSWPYADQLVHGTWRAATLPRLKLSTGASVDAISCATSTSCTAVGSSEGRGLAQPYAATLSHGTWRLVPTAKFGSKDEGAFFSGVSCWRASQCVAVGWACSGASRCLWTAGTAQPSAGLAGPTRRSRCRRAVSAPGNSSPRCRAPRRHPARSWARTAPARSWRWLRAVPRGGRTCRSRRSARASWVSWSRSSCTSATCTAVGEFGLDTYAATRTGTMWVKSAVSIAATLSLPGLFGVSCVAIACVAVGSVNEGVSMSRCVGSG